MEPRSTPHNPFVRPLSAHNVRDARDVPVPPPPFTLQAPIRQSEPTLSNDPFLPRRNDRDNPRPGPVNSLPPSPFSLEKYAASLSRAAPPTPTTLAEGPQTPRDNSGPWNQGDRTIDGFRLRGVHGKLYFLCMGCLQSPKSTCERGFVLYTLPNADVTSFLSLRTGLCHNSPRLSSVIKTQNYLI